MPNVTKITSKDKNEIKLYYQLFFAEKNTFFPQKKSLECLSKDSTAQFADEILEDLQSRNLSDDSIEKINTAIEKEELYFKVYRDDEDKIPEDAFLLQNVRMLPNKGLLELETIIPDTLSQWIPESVKQVTTTAMDMMSAWFSNAILSLKSVRDKTWAEMDFDEWKNCVDEDEAEKEKTEKEKIEENFEPIEISETKPKEFRSEKLYSPFQQLMNSAWQLASYTIQHPLKAITSMLATQVMVAAAFSNNPKSMRSALSSIDTQTNPSDLRSISQLAVNDSFSLPMIFSREIALSNLNGLNGFMIEGFYASIIEDINGDGLAEMVVGMDGPNFVIFGQKNGWSKTFDPSRLNGTNGFSFTSGSTYANVIIVTTSGDINGDGISDLIIGSQGEGGIGIAYVIFGRRNMWPKTFALSTFLNGTNGFTLISSEIQEYHSIDTGDINGDGITDLLLGTNGVGAYVLFGHRNAWDKTLTLSNLNGTNGFKLINTGEIAGETGGLVSTGDINGDGLTDMMVSDTAYNDEITEGIIYVIFGQRNWSATFTLSNLNGTNGFKLIRVSKFNAGIPRAVSSRGDVNGDGLSDIVVGFSDIIYVIFGQKDGWGSILSLSNLNGTNGFKYIGGEEEGNMMRCVSNRGDVNGDGLADIIVGTPNSRRGNSQVIFGQPSVWPATLVLSDLNGANGIKIIAISYLSSVDNGGDINGDGLADMIFLQDSVVYVLFGTSIALCNQLTVNQNQFTLLNSRYLYATYKGASAAFFFNITAIQNGNFYWVGKIQTPITFFSQQNITDGQVQFRADDSISIPQYNISVILGGQTQGSPIPCNVTYYYSPALINNNVVINQGQTILLTQNNFFVTDNNPNVLLQNLIFDFSSVQHGFFSFTTSPQTTVTQVTQQNITSGVIQFTHDNSLIPPSYFLTVTDQYGARCKSVAGVVDFDINPVIVTNQLQIAQFQKIIFSSNALEATHQGIKKENLLFTIAHLAYGYFYYLNDSDVFITQFYQKNITDSIVVFEQTGEKLPRYQVSVSDGRTSSAYEQAKITFYLPPTPAPTIISTPNSKTSFDDFLMKSLISGAISGVIGLGFLAVKIYLSHKAQKKLNQITEEKEGVGKDLAEYRHNVIRPVARTIFERVKLSSCLDYISDETMTDYLSAIETLVSTLSRRGVLDSFDTLSVPQQHQIIHEVAKQTKQVLVPTVACCSSENFFRFFRPDITPDDIEKNVGKIVDCVVAALHESVMIEDGAQKLNIIRTRTRTDVSGEGDALLRPLLGMV
jgi:hypothetical protein